MSLLPTAVPVFKHPDLSLGHKKRQGFALLITITLLAFLVLLLVSLASLTRVETQVAGNNQQLAQARQNALMALNIAIGQLQKTVGPDQRVTAEADLMASTFSGGPAYNASAAQFDTYWVNKSRHWTGAWGNQAAIDNTYSQSPSALPSNLYQPLLLSWLVSGNEKLSFTPNTTDGSVSGGATPVFTPNSTINNLSAATATSTNITINGQPAALLVGPSSVPTATATKCDYVAAPLVPIQVPASSIPGAGAAGATPVTIGNYAYWVGDDGVKARANLVDNYLQQTTTADQDLAKAYSYTIAQHSGINFMDLGITTNEDPTIAATPSSPMIDKDFNYNNTSYTLVSSQYIPSTLASSTVTIDGLQRVSSSALLKTSLTKVVGTNQAPLIGASNPASTASPTSNSTSTTTNLVTAQKNRFHDITLYSSSVLSDTYAGGLKKDLTRALANNSATPTATTPLFKPINATDFAVPTWGLLRSYAQLRNGNGRDVNNHVYGSATVLPSSTQVGVSNLITFADLGFGAYIRNADKHLILTIHPVVALWEPFPFAIAPQNYEVCIGLKNFGPIQLSQNDGAGPTPIGPPGGLDVMSKLGVTLDGTSYLRFSLNSNAGVEGVFTRVFGAPNSSTSYPSPAPALTTPASPAGYLNGQGATAGQNFAFYDTGIVIIPPSPAGTFSITLTSDNGSAKPEMSIILTDFHGLISGAKLGNGQASNWYQAIQRVTMTGYSPNLTLGSLQFTDGTIPADPTSTNPLFVFRAQQALAGYTNNQSSNIGMPADYQPRYLASTNLRARLSTSTQYDQSPTPHNASFGGILKTSITNQFDIYNADNPGGNGRIATDAGHSGGPGLNTFDISREDTPLLSLGQLQNANLSIIDAYPAFPLGNSLADVRIPRDQTYVSGIVEDPQNSGSFSMPYYDLSWHINRTLWDQFFVSTVPTGGMTGSAPAAGLPSGQYRWAQTQIDQNKPLPNARMTYYKKNGNNPNIVDILPPLTAFASGKSYQKAAANLMLAGGFNVNSTSQQAWRATLGGTYNVPFRSYYTWRGPAFTPIGYGNTITDMYWQQSTSGGSVYMPDTTTPIPNGQFPRSSTSSETGPKINGTPDSYGPDEKSGYWSGNRELSVYSRTYLPGVITEFSKNLVQEIRLRAKANNGPFLAMSDFVNRRLVTKGSTYASTGLKGTLQAALDTNTSSNYSVNPDTYLSASSGNMRALSPDTTKFTVNPNPNYDYSHMIGTDSYSGTPTSTYTNRAAFAPKFLTQADMLSAIGPGLTARSDTFTVRTYGEVRNPVTQVVEGRAWCEAVVQRLPEYIDQTDTAVTNASGLGDATLPSNLTSTLNKTFGRRLKIVQFRWLTPSDI